MAETLIPLSLARRELALLKAELRGERRATLRLLKSLGWDESKHHRDHGRFSSGGDGGPAEVETAGASQPGAGSRPAAGTAPPPRGNPVGPPPSVDHISAAVSDAVAGLEPHAASHVTLAAVRAATKAHAALAKLTPAMFRALDSLGLVFDTPADLQKFGWSPGMSGTATGDAMLAGDPVRAATGVPSHIAAAVAAKVLGAGLVWARQQLGMAPLVKKSELAPDFAGLAAVLAEAMGAVAEGLGLDAPDPLAIAAALQAPPADALPVLKSTDLSAPVVAAIRSHSGDDLSGLCVHYHPDGPRFWIDQMDWHDGKAGATVIAAAEKAAGVKAGKERDARQLADAYHDDDVEPQVEPAVYVVNEGPAPPGDGWIDLMEKAGAIRKAMPGDRPTAAVDLDGTLATYDGWKGSDHFGDPRPGAADFLRSLSQTHRVLIFTTRTKDDDPALLRTGNAQNRHALASLVRGWLEQNGLPYDDVYIGQGKPLADVYVDDRAVPVPSNPGPGDYAAALDAIRSRPVLKAVPADADPHAALYEALLAAVIEARETGDDDAVPHLVEAYREHLDGWAEIHKAGRWDSNKHPRNDHGQFVSRDAIADAKGDPEKEEALRDQVTDPDERAKLDNALAGTTDLGRTKRGQAKHEARQRREKKAADHARATEIADRIGAGTATHEDMHELGDHLEGLTLDKLRSLQARIATDVRGRRKADVVSALKESLERSAHMKRVGVAAGDGRPARDDLTPLEARILDAAHALHGRGHGDHVAVHKLRDALPDVPRETFDATIRDLRRKKAIDGFAFGGWSGRLATPEENAGKVPEARAGEAWHVVIPHTIGQTTNPGDPAPRFPRAGRPAADHARLALAGFLPNRYDVTTAGGEVVPAGKGYQRYEGSRGAVGYTAEQAAKVAAGVTAEHADRRIAEHERAASAPDLDDVQREYHGEQAAQLRGHKESVFGGAKDGRGSSVSVAVDSNRRRPTDAATVQGTQLVGAMLDVREAHRAGGEAIGSNRTTRGAAGGGTGSGAGTDDGQRGGHLGESQPVAAGDRPISVGDAVKYTGRGADPDESAEFRGYHTSPETGKKMARVIFRPKSGPPFETSVDVADITHAGPAPQARSAPAGAKVDAPTPGGSAPPPAAPKNWRDELKGKPRWQAVETLRQRDPHELTEDEFANLKTYDHEDSGRGDPTFRPTGLRGSGSDIERQQKDQYDRHVRQQWRDARDAAFVAGKPVSAKPEWATPQGEYVRDSGNDVDDHRMLVSNALAAGKPVPPEVLADYPDLAPKPA